MKWNTLITPIQTHSDDDTLTERPLYSCFFSLTSDYERYIYPEALDVKKRMKKKKADPGGNGYLKFSFWLLHQGHLQP